MTILNLPDCATVPGKKVKAKIKLRLGRVVARSLVYSVTACSRR